MNKTAHFLAVIPSETKTEILSNIAKHYGIGVDEAYDEVTDDEAEHFLDYVTGQQRAATSVLMQQHGLK